MGIAALILIITGFLCIFTAIVSVKLPHMTRAIISGIGTALCAIGTILAFID